jgi:predicted nucleic acid-binding Zn ribbon protein
VNDKSIVGIIGIVGFCVITLTPIVPLTLNNYGVESGAVVKTVIGILSMICGYAILHGFVFKGDNVKMKKEGRMRVRIGILMFGIIIIVLAWLSNIPTWLSDLTGLSDKFDWGNEIGIVGGVGVRIFTSLMSIIGVFLCKLSIKREKHVIADNVPKNKMAYDYARGEEY